jgi:hypothetical protein
MARLIHISGLIIGILFLTWTTLARAQEATTPAPSVPNAEVTSPDQPDQSEETEPDEFSVGELPDIQTVELNPELARRALDTYLMIGEKYKDAEIENYETLQEFVDGNPRGKEFEADLKAKGFNTVDEWNIAVATLGFAYSNIAENQTEDINQQIEELKSDTELAQDMKDKMIKSLQAMIPSANNVKIVEDMLADPAYAEKMKAFSNELDIQRE